MGTKLTKSSSAAEKGAATSAKTTTKKKKRILCLHGWRTSGHILSCQSAAMQHHTDLDFVFIDAPHAAVGEPDDGIAMFYPDQPYFEWFIRNAAPAIPPVPPDEDEDMRENLAASPEAFAGLDQSLICIIEALRTKGPFDGVLGFSQGAGMVARLAYIQMMQQEQQQQQQQQQQKSACRYDLSRYPSTLGLFRFVILVGGVPPQELEAQLGPGAGARQLPQPSLHIQGQADMYIDRSHRLEAVFSPSPCIPSDADTSASAVSASAAAAAAGGGRTRLEHAEGHNIPSLRTGLYPKINTWLASI